MLSFPWSNAGFAVPMPSENTECFLEGLKRLFEQAGGVPTRLVLDNASAAVVSIGEGEERELTEAFMRFQSTTASGLTSVRRRVAMKRAMLRPKSGTTRRQWLCPPQPLNSFEELADSWPLRP